MSFIKHIKQYNASPKEKKLKITAGKFNLVKKLTTEAMTFRQNKQPHIKSHIHNLILNYSPRYHYYATKLSRISFADILFFIVFIELFFPVIGCNTNRNIVISKMEKIQIWMSDLVTTYSILSSVSANMMINIVIRI